MISRPSLATDTVDLTTKVLVSEGDKRILKKFVNNVLKVTQNQPNMSIATTIINRLTHNGFEPVFSMPQLGHRESD